MVSITSGLISLSPKVRGGRSGDCCALGNVPCPGGAVGELSSLAPVMCRC